MDQGRCWYQDVDKNEEHKELQHIRINNTEQTGRCRIDHKDDAGYDEYLDLQMLACESKGKVRWDFAMCYYYIPLEFMGQIERITGKAVCFKRIFVSGMYPDGTCFDGKEEHVWIDKHGLEQYAVGDCLSFFAEPYRYIKTGSGKQIDFGLRMIK